MKDQLLWVCRVLPCSAQPVIFLEPVLSLREESKPEFGPSLSISFDFIHSVNIKTFIKESISGGK